MKAVDTSLVVAAFASRHEHHEPARRALDGAGVGMIEHCAVATYSLLTRLPPPHRSSGARSRLHPARFPQPFLRLSASAYRAFVLGLPDREVTGGATYDALVAATDVGCAAQLVTCDRRAAAVYESYHVKTMTQDTGMPCSPPELKQTGGQFVLTLWRPGTGWEVTGETVRQEPPAAVTGSARRAARTRYRLWHPRRCARESTEIAMTAPLHELEAQVLQLPPQDRAHLLERLIHSFEPDTEVERAWLEEALRREADVKAGRSKMIPADEALQRARARIA